MIRPCATGLSVSSLSHGYQDVIASLGPPVASVAVEVVARAVQASHDRP